MLLHAPAAGQRRQKRPRHMPVMPEKARPMRPLPGGCAKVPAGSNSGSCPVRRMCASVPLII